MFEGVVAALLNRFLGKYVQDLDTEHLNVGIFGGDVQLHNLRLRPEALYELDLPIEVKAGTIGRVSLNIPWSGLYTESVVVTVEDVYVVAGPVIQGPYDAERDKRLLRAAKKRVLSDWLGDAMGDSLGAGVPNTASFLESLVTTVMNNLQIFIRNVHVRYEDTVMHPDPAMTFTCGICLFNLSVEFTNNKWKPCPSSPGASSVYQLIRIESLSAYVNPEGKAIVGDRDPDQLSMSWLEDMARGLKQFNTGADPLKFVLQPVSAKVKVIVNRSSEARVPKLLVDFVVEDVSLRMTREQFVSLRRLQESLGRYRVAWRFRALRPAVGRGRACGSGGSGWARAWWHFAYEAVLEQRVRPYTWARVRAHRDVYARYRDALARALLRPNDTELRLDLQRLEDQLGVVDILVAREHAKLQLHREDPQRVAVAARTPSWWGRWFASGASTSLEQDSRSPSPELQVRAERARGLWAQLTASERERLFEAIGHAEGAQRPEKPKQYIEHKLNVTLVNCSASLLSDTGEVLAAHLSHALASLETRPSANAYKLSLRLESAVVEGASLEHHLVPLVTANVHSGNNYSNFLAIDIEKNPSKTDADFGLSITMEPMEIVYHEHAVSELLDFFCVKPRPWKDLISSAGSCASDACRVVRGLCRRALTRRSTYCLSVDLRGPYVVIPESGSMQKGGQVLVVDFGRVVARTELQPPGVSLEDATQMEMEERLYDRLHVECSEAQVLFCDSGDEWRESRRLQDSELHVVPKARGQLVFSNSVRPECRQLARHKLTVSLASLKLNLSDRRIGLALDFMENVPAPKARRSSRSGITEYGLGDDASGLLFPGDRVPAGLSAAQLARVRRVVALAAVRVVRGGDTHHSDVPKAAVPDMDRSFVSSDQSDSEEAELWARTVDLPGFDDNVSPHNAITMLLRFVIGEVVVNLARSSNRVDKPYLLLRLGKLCWDSAIMEYGPAVQVSLGSVQLVDRLHAVPGGGGRYLEMISTDGSAEDDVLSLLYRKVRSNCPDFKSHFHAVEKSLVVDVATVSLVLHQEAFVTLNKYLQYIADKVQSRDSLTSRVSEGMRPSLSAARSAACSLWRSVDDPPIPQGATKLSWSARLSELRLRLCDADLDQLDVRVSGLEGDCMFKANERMVLRTHLMSLHVEDLTDATLYQRVIQLDDERVLDFKYVRHAPRLYSGLGGGLAGGLAGAAEDDVKSDGSLKVKLGRMRVVLLYKTLIDLQHFVEPLGQVPVPRWLAGALPPLRSARALDRAAGRLRTWPTRLHVSLDLHLPALLLPQKTASPNLVVANLGDLTVENFFKEVPSATPDGSVCGGAVIDNILVRLDGVNLSRGVMTLAGALHVLEPILEPVALRLDVKRLVASAGSSTGSLLLYEVNGGVDLISLSLSQRDLATLLAVWTDNLAEGRFFDFSDSQVSPLEPTSPGHGHGHGHGHGQDDQVRQLQQFFAQSEQGRREASVRLTLDGLNLRLFNDVDEMLSSPVRDINGSLCHLELGEASLTLDAYADRSLDLRASLLTCVLEDIRLDYKTELCRVFHSHAGETRPQGPQGDWDSCAGISVSQPPIVELTFRRSAAGDRSLDILVEQTRLNLTVSFLAAVAHFVLDALPSDADSNAQGVVNQGYVGDLNVHQHKPQAARPPSSEDSTSGCFSSRASCAGGSGGDQPGLAVSLQLRKPEVLLASDARGRRGHGLLLRTEVTLDYNRHSYRETVLCSLASLRVLSLPAGAVTAAATAAGGADGDGADREPCHQVLFPCDIEFNKTFKTAEEGVKVVASVSPVHVHLCASTVRTILEIAADVNTALQYQPEEASPLTLSAPDVPKTPDGPNSTPAATAAVAIETEDMWIAKKAQPYGFSEPCEGLGCGYAMPPQEYISETMTVTVPEVRVVLELEADKKCVPLVLVRAAAEAHVRDWTTQLHMRAELQLQASFMNGALGSWEPLIEPVVEAENVFRPWELQVRLFRAKAFPISGRVESVADGDGGGGGGGRVGGGGRRASRKRSTASHSTQGQGHGTLQPEDSQTSGEDTEPEHGMAFIRRPRSDGGQEGQLKESASVASHVDDSDSEDEDGVMEKLAGAIGYLFSGDSSDGEASESDESSAAEPSAATEEASEMETASADASTVIGTQERAIFLTKHSDSVDSGLEAEPMERQANYLLLQAKDRLELTVSPEALRALSRLRASFSLDPVNNNLRASYPPLSLNNSLGPGSSAVITTKAEKGLDGADRVLARSRSPEEETDSAPGSPHASPTHRKHLDSDVHLYSADVRDGGDDVLYCNASHHGDELFSPVMKFPQDSISELYRKVTDLRLTANVEGFEPIQVLCPRRSCHKLHALLPAKNGVRYHIMLDVETGCQYSRVTVRSPLQVRNETAFSIGLYYKKSVFDGLGLAHIGEATNPFDDAILFATLEPDKVCDVPLHVAYNCKLHFHPAYHPFRVSEAGLWWKDLAADLNIAKDFHCPAKDDKDPKVFSCRVMCSEGVPVKQTHRSIPNYMLRLLPPLQFYNALPFAVELRAPVVHWEQRVEAGERASQYFLDLQRGNRVTVDVPAYLGLSWSGAFNLGPELEEKTIVMATEKDTEGGNKTLAVTVRVDRTGTGSCVVYLHAPFWVVNKTGLPLQLRGSLSDVVYDVTGEEALLFSFRKVRRRCVRLRAYHSSWSSAFALDNVDTNGLVVCRDRERRRHYRILLSVRLSSGCPHLTKIVTLLPNLVVSNRSGRPLRFMEENEKADLWLDLAAGQSAPFWPVTDSMRMMVKYRDSALASQHFPVTHTHSTVLRMDRGTALVVDVSGGGDAPFHVAFRSYREGDAPLRVDNLCEDLFLKVHQQGLGQAALLSPYQSMLYTWDDPVRERCLLWNVYNKKSKGFVADFWKDGYGQERVCFHSVRQPPGAASSAPASTVTAKLSAGLKLLSPKAPRQDGGSSSSDDTESDDLLRSQQQLRRTRRDKVVVFWVSFLEGQQRVLLFTQDERVAAGARRRIQSERAGLEAFVSLAGVGLSLAAHAGAVGAAGLAGSRHRHAELAYLSLTDSAAVWEVCVGHRWKALGLELASWLEDKWRHDMKRAQMKEYVHVDFEKMHMTKPFYGELRRRYNPALWVQVRRSGHLTYARTSIHRMQLDNQLPSAHFPTVLCPAAAASASAAAAPAEPGLAAARGALRPCLDVIVLKRARPAHSQDVYKYVKVLMQEWCVQLERDFLDTIFDAYPQWGMWSARSGTRGAAGPGAAAAAGADDEPHRLLEGLRQDVALSYLPVQFAGAKTKEDSKEALFEHVHVSPILVRLSMFPRRSARPGGGKGFPLRRMAVVDHVFNALVPPLAEVKNVRLKMAYFERQGLRAAWRSVAADVRRHYYSQLMQQVHALVLGLDVLANPYGLVSDLGDLSFFYEPCAAIIEGPDEFAEDLSRAAQALLGNLTGAEAGGLSLLAPSLGAVFAFEDEYKKRRRHCLQQATDLPESARAASRTFSMGVLMGLSGVVLRPSVGVPQEGAEGFFRGTGKGLLGLMTKPGGNVVDCVAMAHDGIKRATEVGEDMMMRTRLPRHLDPLQGVRPFSPYEATGHALLGALCRGLYADMYSDTYWAHAGIDAKATLLITLQHVFLLEQCRQWGPSEVEWFVRVDDILEVPKLEGSKLIFKVRQDDNFTAFSGDERSVSSEDLSVLMWLRDKLEAVLVLNMEDKPVPTLA